MRFRQQEQETANRTHALPPDVRSSDWPYCSYTEAQQCGDRVDRRIENGIRGKPPDERRTVCQQRAKPLLDDLER
jgi:hypothetical protein